MMRPVYPNEAKEAHVQGTIILHAVLAREGTVQDLKYVSGPEMLMKASMDAVRQWRYAPTLLNGEPVEVDTTISVVFTLSDGAPPDNDAALAAESGQDQKIDPQLKADIVQMMNAMHVKDQMATMGKTMLNAVRPQLLSAFAAEPNKEQIVNLIGEKLAALLQSDEAEDALVQIYARHLSDEDVKAVSQFYASAPGQHILAALPEIVSEASQVGQNLVKEHMTEIINSICHGHPELKISPDTCPPNDEKPTSLIRRTGQDVLAAVR